MEIDFTDIDALYIEQENSGFVMVCVAAMGTLSQDVIVTLNTSDLTAISPGTILCVLLLLHLLTCFPYR